MEKKNTHIVYGLVTGLVMAITSLVIYISGIAFVQGMQYVVLIPLLVGIILDAIAFSKANNGFVTFGNVFGSGFKMAMIVTLVMIAWSLLSIVIFPDMKEKALTSIRQEMMKKNNTDEQIDMAINMTKKYWNVFLVAAPIVSNLFWGAIFSLIGGAVAKKKGQQPFVPNNP